MLLQHLRPHPRLIPHIEKMWLFESDTGIPPGDMKTVVPNGLLKMIISYRGSLISSRQGKQIRVSPEGSISIVGLMEQPVTIDSSGPTGTIGIEFKPASAYRFFPFSLREVTNSVQLCHEVLGRYAREIEVRLADLPKVEDKIALIQRYLVSLLGPEPREDPVIEWAVAEILRSGGAARISDLGARLGYSRRYLDLRFAQHVGVSPKLLSGIVRFLHVFRHYARREARTAAIRGIPDQYYDQSHFIREFKRFAGRSPRAYLDALNDFGEIFYRVP